MDNSRFVEDAIKHAKLAADADNLGIAATTDAERRKHFQVAMSLYDTAIERFTSALRFEKDQIRVKTLMDAAVRYAERAEKLKSILDTPRVDGGGSGGATAQRPPGEGGADDAETTKLKGALSSAIVSEKPNVKWEDVAGLEGAKEALKEAVILPAKFPQLFVGNRKPWKGILLYGPPGTGKSYLAKAVATEANATFFAISAPDLLSKWQGESEKLVRQLFELAREKKPSIIFIDEVDSLTGARGEGSESESARRIKTEFLVQMQGVGKTIEGVLVLAATNIPWEIDPAMRRRFEKRIYIPLPEPHARTSMFKIHLGDTPHNLRDEDFDELGRMSEGMSGSDVSVVVRSALMTPLRTCRTAKFFIQDSDGKFEPTKADPPCPRCPLFLSDRREPKGERCRECGYVRLSLLDLDTNQLKVPVVSMDDFREVLTKAKATVGASELVRFEQWTREYGESGEA